MKFRKKPVIIEAEQFLPDKKPWPKGIIHEFDVMHNRQLFHVATLEGIHMVSPGDWIITGIKGEKYPCKPDIFELTYEKIEN